MKALYNPNFRFRESEIQKIHTQFDIGGSVLITGIRRTGKTELMCASLHEYKKLGHAVGHIDTQDIGDLSVFYQKLLEVLIENAPNDFKDKLTSIIKDTLRLPDNLMTWLRSHFNKVKAAGIEVEVNPTTELKTYWQVLVEEIAGLLATFPPEKLPVIGIDELPLMLENLIAKNIPKQELSEMLASLRKLRASGLRMIICGSVSFESVLEIHGISRIVLGGLFMLKLNPFTRLEAREFLFERFNLSNPDIPFCAQEEPMNFILDTLPDYVPEILQIAHGHLFLCKTLEECQFAIDNHVMPDIRRGFSYQFQERLKDNFKDDILICAVQILDVIANAPPEGTLLDSRTFPENYFLVLTKLQYDNFIEDAPHGAWRFCLNAIRIWWRNNRGIK